LASLTVELLSAQDDRWEQLLERCPHDIYQSPRYCSVSARVDGGIAQAALVQRDAEGMLLPFVRRELPDGLWDGISPYGYPGPVWTGETDHDRYDEMFRAALDRLGDAGCVSLFLRMHPGLNAQWPRLTPQRVTRCSSSQTVCIDLTRSDREIWSDTASGHRNEINRAGRRGYNVTLDHEAAYLYDFARLYRANMVGLGARSYYCFDDGYFHDLHEALGTSLNLVVVLHENNFVGGALFTSHGDWVQYHLSAADPDHRGASPAKLVIDARRRWGQEQGYRWLHLGGGRGGAADSLFRFKAAFSSSRLTFRTAGVVLRPRDYADLVDGREREDGPQVDRFPAYRI
jgi:Acetyltransferase (GNAT) domain